MDPGTFRSDYEARPRRDERLLVADAMRVRVAAA
jgi:hypothetical protein